MKQPYAGVRVSGLLEVAGAALVFIGAYVPWAVTTALLADVPVRGVDTDYGRVLPLLPLAALGLLAWSWYVRRAPWVHALVVALGAVLLVLALVYALQVKRNLTRAQESLFRSGQFPGTVDVRFDVGMYLTAAGAASLIAGGALGTREHRPRG